MYKTCVTTETIKLEPDVGGHKRHVKNLIRCKPQNKKENEIYFIGSRENHM